MHVDGRVGHAIDNVADDVDAAAVVVRVEAKGEPRVFQSARFLAAADDVIDNSAGYAELAVQVERLHGAYLRLASEGGAV